MPNIQRDICEPLPLIEAQDIPSMSDDECLVRLARAVDIHDVEELNEVAQLIGRLAIPIE